MPMKSVGQDLLSSLVGVQPDWLELSSTVKPVVEVPDDVRESSMRAKRGSPGHGVSFIAKRKVY